MKRIIVTGLEISGTKWVTAMLGKHPAVTEAIHTSIPEYLEITDIKTRWPELNGADAVVWLWRYEPFRLQSVLRENYDADRSETFVPPQLYVNAERLYFDITAPVVMVSYEGLVGPCGRMVWVHTLRQLGLDPVRFPFREFAPVDANKKYFPG